MTLSTEPAPGSAPWRRDRTSALLAFGRGSQLPGGGFGWLTEQGAIHPSMPRPLFLTARMTYVFSLASLAGDAIDGATDPDATDPDAAEGAGRAAAGGFSSILEDYADRRSGGWFASLDSSGAVDDRTKANYAHAHVLLAAATGAAAGIASADEVLEQVTAVIDRHFWSDDEQCAVENWDDSFSELEPYRGANSNMHSVEAYLVAGDVTGDPVWHARALAIAGRLIDDNARTLQWRIPEHFDADWQPVLDFNSDHPDDRFRPFGTTPGHAFEWARLLIALEARLDDPPPWLAEAAVGLYDRAVAEGWAADGGPGFVYTVDLAGAPVVRQRLHWVVCEAVLAADSLHRRTGEARFATDAGHWWQHIAAHFLDTASGGWWQELDPSLRPAATIWPGKPDLYHSYQALVLPSLPLAPSAAQALLQRARDAAGMTARPAAAGPAGAGPVGAGPTAAGPAGVQPQVHRPVALFIGGPPASGKSTLAAALAPALGAALIDLDVATGPLTALVLELIGARDLSEPRAARLTRGPRYATVLALAEDSLRSGTSVVVVAPLTLERDAVRWARLTGRLAAFADVHLVWLVLDRQSLAARMHARAAARDAGKLGDPEAYLAGLDLAPPAAPHLAVDAGRPLAELVEAVRTSLAR